MKQQQLLFWHGHAPSSDLRRLAVDPANDNCPFSQFVGNDKAIKRLGRSAFVAMENQNHRCDKNFALIGPASTGKTTLAKLFAELLGLPFVEVSPRSLTEVNELLAQIADKLHETEFGGVRLSLIPNGHPKKFILPPMVIFIDEVHALRPNIVQGLLKAVERGDSELFTEKGYRVDTKNVCWIIATTHPHKLFGPFRTRFVQIPLKLYSLSEVGQIIKLNFPQWDQDTCDLVARYGGRLPREALAFAADVEDAYAMEDNPDDWEPIVKKVAADHDIDEYGMTYQRLDILKLLGQQGPMSAKRLARTFNINDEELTDEVMAALEAVTEDQPVPLVAVSSKGYSITNAGLDELDKRGIANLGTEAFGPGVVTTAFA